MYVINALPAATPSTIPEEEPIVKNFNIDPGYHRPQPAQEPVPQIFQEPVQQHFQEPPVQQQPPVQEHQVAREPDGSDSDSESDQESRSHGKYSFF